MTRRKNDNERLQVLLTEVYGIPRSSITDAPTYSASIVQPESVKLLENFLHYKVGESVNSEAKSIWKLTDDDLGKTCDSILVLSPESGLILNSILRSVFENVTQHIGLQSSKQPLDVLKGLSLGAVGPITALQIVEGLPQSWNDDSNSNDNSADEVSGIRESRTAAHLGGHEAQSSLLLSAVFIPPVATKANLFATFPHFQKHDVDIPTALLLGPSSSSCPTSRTNRQFHYLPLYTPGPPPNSPPNAVVKLQCLQSANIIQELVVFGCPTGFKNWISMQQGCQSEILRVAVCMGPTTASAVTRSLNFDMTNFEGMVHQRPPLNSFKDPWFDKVVYPEKPGLESLAAAVSWAWRFEWTSVNK